MSDTKADSRADTRNEAWIAAGFAEIARTGIEGVRVELLEHFST